MLRHFIQQYRPFSKPGPASYNGDTRLDDTHSLCDQLAYASTPWLVEVW